MKTRSWLGSAQFVTFVLAAFATGNLLLFAAVTAHSWIVWVAGTATVVGGLYAVAVLAAHDATWWFGSVPPALWAVVATQTAAAPVLAAVAWALALVGFASAAADFRWSPTASQP